MQVRDLPTYVRQHGVVATMRAAARKVGGNPIVIRPDKEPDPTPFEGVLDWLRHRDHFTIVQIGAYVGNTPNDPLWSFLNTEMATHPGSQALLMEPIEEYYKQLKDNYAAVPGVTCEHVAIADAPGEREMYRIEPEAMKRAAVEHPDWLLGQLNSFHKDRMESRWDNFEKYPEIQAYYLANRITEFVRCDTLAGVLERHGIGDVDLLQIDAEGFDYEILRSLDFSRTHPMFVNYERTSLLPEHVEPCRDMMRAAGYVLFDWGADTMCVAHAALPDRRTFTG